MIKVAPIQLLGPIPNVPEAKRAVSTTPLLHLGLPGLPALSNPLALLLLFPPPLHPPCAPLQPPWPLGCLPNTEYSSISTFVFADPSAIALFSALCVIPCPFPLVSF